jgi:hypothetical protein
VKQKSLYDTFGKHPFVMHPLQNSPLCSSAESNGSLMHVFLSETLKLPKDSQLGQDDFAKDERLLVVDRVEPVARHHFRAKLLPEQCHQLVRGGGGRLGQ